MASSLYETFKENKDFLSTVLVFLVGLFMKSPIMAKTKKDVYMEIGHSGVLIEYVNGVGILKAYEGALELHIKAALLINPALDSLILKIESGELDLIKGTDLDKVAILQAIAYIKSEINK